MMTVSVTFGQSEEAQKAMSEVLEQLKSQEGYTGDFTMKMYFGNDLEAEESGTISTWNKNVMMDLGQFKYVSDGTSSWTYLKDRNEVQINHVTDDDFSMYNPLVMLDHFFDGGYAYEITDRLTVAADEQVKLDIKPEDRDSEYAKVSITLSTSQKMPTALMLLQKDGYRYNIDITNIEVNPTQRGDQYTFDPADYPDVIVEDLRLD